MKTTPVSPADLAASVLAVPPLARKSDMTIDRAQNARLLDHLRSGGVRTFMYGGNANLYNMGVSELATLAELLIELSRDGDWMVPSVGSDYGKAHDQLKMLRDYPFPTAMVLPNRFPATPAGIATGYRKLADAYGKAIIAYVKDDGFVEAADLGRLAADGVICAVKYAIVRDEPKTDLFLDQVLSKVDRSMVISGIGERPAIDHLTKFGLQAFTSGSVCVAPGLSTALLRAIKRGDLKEAERLRALFIPLEDQRDRHSPLRVLHEACGSPASAIAGRCCRFCPTLPIRRSFPASSRRQALLAAERSATARAA